MGESDSTCWTVIRNAAAGAESDREDFARRYGPIVRAYLGARWRGSRHVQELEDAAQEVFVECFRQGGVLERADPERSGDFRPFLYGVVRNVALRVESRRARQLRREESSPSDLDGLEREEATLSQVFDRAWAASVLREAAAVQEEKARADGEAARRRVDLLRLRFQDQLPIREIASRWGVEAETLHREYARARDEFRRALLEVIAFHHPGSRAEVEARCSELLALL